MNNPGVIRFIKEHGSLFWWIRGEDKEKISTDFLVETILNYGNEKDVKRLFEIVGVRETVRRRD